MHSTVDRSPVSPGELAPNFRLPAIDGTENVSLSDFISSSPLLLVLSIGLWCPFCRRSIAQLAGAQPKLRSLGVQTLCVVATDVENARLYFKFRPTSLRLASDPELTTHRAYGLPKPQPTPEFLQELDTVRIYPDGVYAEPLPVKQAADEFTKADGYVMSETDGREVERQWPQRKGQFLIDRDGIVRWTNVECSRDGLAELGRFPSADELMAAARSIVSH
jgi:peroxiredoxin